MISILQAIQGINLLQYIQIGGKSMHKYLCLKFSVCTVVLFVFAVGIAVSADNDCDPKYKDVELYLCKAGRVSYNVGLKQDDIATCVEHKKLKVTGCAVEPVKDGGREGGATIYMLGSLKKDYDIDRFEFQCAPETGQRMGGMKTDSFDKWMHPDYFPTKTPGKYSEDRNAMFDKDMAKKGRKLIGQNRSVFFTSPDPSIMKYDKQVCQFFNASTGKVAFKFYWSTDAGSIKGNGETSVQPKQEEGKSNPLDNPESAFDMK